VGKPGAPLSSSARAAANFGVIGHNPPTLRDRQAETATGASIEVRRDICPSDNRDAPDVTR
jgi:hypothetical protein